MKQAWIYILVGVTLLKIALVGSDVHQVEQRLAKVQSQLQMARLVMPVLRSMSPI